MKFLDLIKKKFKKKRIDDRVQCHLCKGLYPKEFCYQMEIDRSVPFFVCEDCSEEDRNCVWEVSP